MLEVAEVDGALAEIALRFRDCGAKAVLLGDHAHHVRLGRDDDFHLLLRHLAIGIDSDGIERIHHRHDELPVADGDRHHLVLARERSGDLRLDHLHVELQRIDLEERHMRILGDQTREEKVVHARVVAAGIGQVHARERLERAGVIFGARLR